MIEINSGPMLSNKCDSRIPMLDIVKGMGIILVVVGHSGAPFEHFISLFLMAIFFMASGYCWNDKYVRNFDTAKSFIIKRVKSLWLPFALCNGIFSVCHNLFLQLGIYTSDENILLLDPVMSRYLCNPMEAKEILLAVTKNLLFAGETLLGGAMWFLRTLFVVSVVHLVIRWIAVHWKHGRIVQVVLIATTFLMAELTSRYEIRLPMGIHTCFAAYIAFLCGMMLKRTDTMEKTKEKAPILIAGSMIILVIGNFLGGVSMNGGRITNVAFFVVMSLAGWILLWEISRYIKGICADVFIYCGQHSIWIVMLHFLAFKLVSVVYQKSTGASSLVTALFPVIQDGFLWIAYVLTGTFVPLLIYVVLQYCVKFGKGKRK